MTMLLHILTKPEDSLAAQVIARQESDPSRQVVVVDATHPELDYLALLEKIFEADSIAVW